MLEDAMWRPNERVEEDASDPPGMTRTANAAAHAAAHGVMGLLTKPSLAISKTFDPTERSSVSSLAVLILDP